MFVFICRSPAILANITPNVTSVKMESGQPQTRFVNFMLQESQGCFLYSKMVLDLIERGYLVIKSSSFNVLPLSLSELFLLEFNLKFSSTRSFEKVQDILETALASLVPLTPSELFSSFNALSQGNLVYTIYLFLLKVSKSRKQIMIPLILPKNDQNSLRILS